MTQHKFSTLFYWLETGESTSNRNGRKYRRKVGKMRDGDPALHQKYLEQKRLEYKRNSSTYRKYNQLRWIAVKNDPIKLEKHKSYRKRNKAKYEREYMARLRERLLELLGGRCIECGLADPLMQDIDHIHGNGKQDRKEKGKLWMLFYINHPRIAFATLQILCVYCHRRKKYSERETRIDKTGGSVSFPRRSCVPFLFAVQSSSMIRTL